MHFASSCPSDSPLIVFSSSKTALDRRVLLSGLNKTEGRKAATEGNASGALPHYRHPDHSGQHKKYAVLTWRIHARNGDSYRATIPFSERAAGGAPRPPAHPGRGHPRQDRNVRSCREPSPACSNARGGTWPQMHRRLQPLPTFGLHRRNHDHQRRASRHRHAQPACGQRLCHGDRHRQKSRPFPFAAYT